MIEATAGTGDGRRDDTRSVRLRVPARPEHAAIARLALGGLAPLAALDEETLAELKRTLTEAVTGLCAGMAAAGGAVEIRYELSPLELRIDVVGDGAEPAGVGLGPVATRTIVLERQTTPRPGDDGAEGRVATHPGLDA